MAGQQQPWATICGGAPPELDVRRLQEGDMFAQTTDLHVATERCFLADSRGIRADKKDLVENFIAVMALYSTLK